MLEIREIGFLPSCKYKGVKVIKKIALETDMENLNEEQVRKVIGSFYKKNYYSGKIFTVKHFIAMGVSKSTIYSVLQRYEEGGDAERKTGSGRIARKLPPKQVKRLLNETVGKVGVSQRKLARKYGISPSYVNKTLKRNNVDYRKRKSCPRYTVGQSERAKSAASSLRRNFFPASGSTAIVMDDESYFPLKDDNISGNTGFYVPPGGSAGDLPDEVRLRPKSKYPEKLLVWIAISERGISKPYYLVKKASLTGQLYRDECIQKYLVPFLEEYHSDGNFRFWPDLATSHYAHETITLLESLEIPFVPKDKNPPNCPQIRPIEQFWAILKEKVDEGGWEASRFRMLKQRINVILNQMDPGLCQRLFRGLKTKIRKAGDFGVLSVI